MNQVNNKKRRVFYAIGLSYQKADAEIRGDFSLDRTSEKALLQTAKKNGHEALMVISTCNRTELYGFAEHPFQLIKLLCEHTRGSLDEFEKVAFVYKNQDAVSHIFEVGTGLDSQILGDFEIIGQFKQAFVRSKKLQLSNPFLERLANSVVQASKRIKNETGLSSGATSVSFASVHYVLNEVTAVSTKNITLFGTGKIGRNTVENLVKHTKNSHITLVNRSRDKAEKVAGKFNLVVRDYADLKEVLTQTDILIVATGAQQPVVTKALLPAQKEMHILDLSIPKNVAGEVQELPHVSLVHIDQLSAMTNKTLVKRRSHIPDAKLIIEEVKNDFEEWQDSRKFVPTIKALKEQLKLIKEIEIAAQKKKVTDFNDEQAEALGDRIVNKIMNRFAAHLREDGSEEGLELVQNIFQLEEPKS